MATVAQILSYARSLLDDLKEPYLWSDEELLYALQNAYDEFCDKTGFIRDSSSSITSIPLLSNVNTYSIDRRIVKIISAKLSDGSLLLSKNEQWMDHYVTNWEAVNGKPSIIITDREFGKLTIYPYYDKKYETIGNGDVSFSASTKTITKLSGGLSKYATGDRINISGTTSNNGYFTVSSVVNDNQIVVSESLANESNANPIIRKVMETIQLTVERLGERFSLFGMDNQEPEISPQWHLKLVDGILKEAYLKIDTETYDPAKSDRHYKLFLITIEEAKRARIKLKHFDWNLRPHRGSL